ncbi:FMN-dependent NADH-azoreductase [Streptomyces sp. NPDC058108]|uniref:FMN-dependent NADH-azoreductase n=1 Tax=Streptomyces sp. NPDC058108 TaxID=3346344 RepID=UPI0036E50598
MPTLLHLDNALASEAVSASRSVAATFRKAWEEQNPDGKVVYRDFASDPLPHLDALRAFAGFTDPASHSPEQSAAFAERIKLVEELESADAVLIGAPMYNYTIPSTLKAWLDQVIIMGRTGGEGTTVKGKPVVVVASRGGSYAHGAPQERFEFVLNYLEGVLGGLMELEVEFIVAELTLAGSVPAMADLIPSGKASLEKAHKEAAERAQVLSARLSQAA